MTIRLAVVLVLLTARLASAESSDEAKSPGVGLALSAGGTAVSIGLIAGGLATAEHYRDQGYTIAAVGLASTLVTPSLGEWYAGKYLTAGLGLRFAGVAATAIGVANLRICFDQCSGQDGNNAVAGTAIVLGLAAYASGMLLDIAWAPSTVRESNARHLLVITPSIVTSPSGAAVYGLGLGGSF
jgi:hypothetical protein